MATPTGAPELVSLQGIVSLFEQFQDTVKLIVLNACYTEVLAATLSRFIDAVVGVDCDVVDSSAIWFSRTFYRALATEGISLRKAFEVARSVVLARHRRDGLKFRIHFGPGVDKISVGMDTTSGIGPEREVDIDALYSRKEIMMRPVPHHDSLEDLSVSSLMWEDECLQSRGRYGNKAQRPLVVLSKHLEATRAWPGWDLSLLLLSHGVSLTTGPEGSILRVDIRNQKYGIYDNGGKKFLIATFIKPPKMLAAARKWAAAVRRHQLQSEPRVFECITRKSPPLLRWASGGYLPVVRWRGSRWILLFFRDIDPIGWNIANGGSESPTERTTLDLLSAREAGEELVILDREPVIGPHLNTYRLDFGLERAAQETDVLLATHGRLRREQDGLYLRPPSEGETIVVEKILGPTLVEVIHGDADAPEISVTSGMHITINPVEMGIEVTEVGEFTLPDDAYVIDGETFMAGEDSVLVRRPVGLFKVSYFQRVMRSTGFAYGGLIPDEDDRLRLPSPRDDETFLFDYDIKMRREMVEDRRPARREAEEWLGEFGEGFDARRLRGELQCFCPAAWKVIESALDSIVAAGTK